jgi:hypothetical protein
MVDNVIGFSFVIKLVKDGKDFQKFLAKKLTRKVDLEDEKAASAFLISIGVDFIQWP